MNHLLHLLLLLPILGFLASLLLPEKAERGISYIAVGTIGQHSSTGSVATIIPPGC